MKILILGPSWRNQGLKDFLAADGHDCELSHREVDANQVAATGYDFILSSGYHLKIWPNVIRAMNGKVINLHATYLPWGKGIGTTFFAFLLGHPTGVSVHYIDADIDTGDIICRRRIDLAPDDTLRSFYHRIITETETLFRENWPLIRDGQVERISQSSLGIKVDYFNRIHSEKFMDELPKKWDTPLAEVASWGAEIAVSEQFWELYEYESGIGARQPPSGASTAGYGSQV